MQETQFKSVADVHDRFKSRIRQQQLSHEPKSLIAGDPDTNGKIEAYIISETDTRFHTMRIVATPFDIEVERTRMEDSGIYLSVIIATRMK